MKAPEVLVVALLLSCASVQAEEYRRVDPAGSQIHFTSRQMGVPVDGSFRQFDASLVFDPDAPAAAKGQLRIKLSSIDTGLREVDDEVVGEQWLDVKRHPEALFELRQIQPQGAGRFQLSGVLNLKGVSQPLLLNAVLKASGRQAVMDGSFVIKRMDFGIGGGAWGDVRVVANEVTVQFHLLLEP